MHGAAGDATHANTSYSSHERAPGEEEREGSARVGGHTELHVLPPRVLVASKPAQQPVKYVMNVLCSRVVAEGTLEDACGARAAR